MGGNPVGAAGADYGIANGVSGVKPSAAGTVAGSGADAARTQTPASAASSEARRDADKTLKCPECGAMNYATEWYCEKCGGELSTF
jgi:membrane protease subunit (stomatin/prohibitin family)